MLQAVEEEKSVYERSSSKPIYLNLAVHALRRLREETTTATDTFTACSYFSPTKNPNSVSHEVILGGPKACQTSFTVHRSGKFTSPPSCFSCKFCKVIRSITVCCRYYYYSVAVNSIDSEG